MNHQHDKQHDNPAPSLPADHAPYTDKYFLRAGQILEKEGLNPMIAMKVFCRGRGPVVGLDDAVEVLTRFGGLEREGGEILVTREKTFSHNRPLMVIRGPVRGLIELETMYLGVLSAAISAAQGIGPPDPGEVTAKMKRLKAIYGDIPIIYFGARHYHWSLDRGIAAAAFRGGAVATSTDIGAAAVGQKGVGTTPHLLTIILASVHGRENATLNTARLFDRHMAPEIPRVTLVDTFNREITDALAVARWFGRRKHALRLDTCGENIGEGGSLYRGEKTADPEFKVGTGVTVELAVHVRNALIREGFGPYADIFLSSGFGDEAKAAAFVAAADEFREKTGYSLFSGVGIGEISRARFCTADVFEVDGRPLAKTGREGDDIDYSLLKRVV